MTGRHYDLDVLADLAEGLLDDETTTTVRGHLAVCALCASHQDELNEVTRMLASAPRPALPENLAARLDAALLAEATRGAPVVDLAARRRAKMTRFVSVAAAAVVVSGVGAFALGNGVLDGADKKDIQAHVVPPTSESAESADPSAAPFSRVASGTDYTADDLAALARNPRRVVGKPAAPMTEAQRGCLARTVPSGKISFVDMAEYQGVPAMIIIAEGAIYVTGPNCSATQDDLLAQSPAS
ncbi:hypothetical protein [Actinocorallia sp. A-T 12471]|uniref:hypothetical protein n=1 Tax=Actinocorallia sp. A-T 12471 TaxID=3089813 RepID=UPI0029D2ABA5|nr:hypothetical protein [Actinocorallia sp. A-T 12471]MDX6742736.1 hypothetical protein [Actinocorallia sp. A-T 12471]